MKKMVVKARMKWAALGGILLSALSLFTHFLLAVYSGRRIAEPYPQPDSVLSWRHRFQNAALPTSSPVYRRLWGPVRHLESLLPLANPRGSYEAPNLQTSGYIFVKIQGGFHDIRNSICDVVAITRLLNATLVIPELHSTTANKGVSSSFKSFAYLYDEDQFIAALANDVPVVKTLPNGFKTAKRRKEITSFRVSWSTSPDFYIQVVLPALEQFSIVELSLMEGGGLQAIIPPKLEEYQRLRCRVAFHALIFRQEIQDRAMKILDRLRSSERPFLVYDTGMTKDALAYHGCSELFQDVHTEVIQRIRQWMIRHKLIKGKLSIDSMKERLNGSCPLMPEEVGILLRAFGYSSDTIIYVSGGEIFGGQRALLPLHAMFENVVDRTLLSTTEELASIYGLEDHLITSYPRPPPVSEEILLKNWKMSGPRPRPLPPPPARPKYPSSTSDWWSWEAQMSKESEMTIFESRTYAHKLIWEAIDYVISVEADAFFPGFDRDGKGRPNFAAFIMGHRLYLNAASKTFRPNRKNLSNLLEEIRDHLHQANQTWLVSVCKYLNMTAFDGLQEASMSLKQMSFISHPVPECSCLRQGPVKSSSPDTVLPKQLYPKVSLGVAYRCPAWMGNGTSIIPDEDEETEEIGSFVSGQLVDWNNGTETGGFGSGVKEDTQLEDQEDLEGEG